jgi:hypothetical protein
MLPHLREADENSLTFDEVVSHITEVHKKILADWGKGGWAPGDAARLLKASRLDWLCSLSHALKVWGKITPDADNHDGLLILAWANLGSLVEGSLKFFLSVFLYDYRRSVSRQKMDSIFKALWDQKAGEPKDVDGLMFDKLREFFVHEVWRHSPPPKWPDWLFHIQQRRNTIHAYKTRDLGTFEEFRDDVRLYRKFLLEEISAVPEPPDQSGY